MKAWFGGIVVGLEWNPPLRSGVVFRVAVKHGNSAPFAA